MNTTNNIGYLLQHVPAVVAKQSDNALQQRLKIGFSQFKILMVLGRNSCLQQRLIAESLGQTEASISRQIKALLEGGLLESRVSPTNRRQHITSPTTKGIRVAEKARRILTECHAPMFERLSDQQVAEMLAILVNMHNYVCQRGKSGACDHPTSI